jgi:hypothetical protein
MSGYEVISETVDCPILLVEGVGLDGGFISDFPNLA